MGLYINYNDAIRIQVPRDLHLNEPEFEEVQIGDNVYVELKRSKFAIHDTYILASGLFLRKDGTSRASKDESEEESEEEEEPSFALPEEVPAEVESEAEPEVEPEDDEEDED